MLVYLFIFKKSLLSTFFSKFLNGNSTRQGFCPDKKSSCLKTSHNIEFSFDRIIAVLFIPTFHIFFWKIFFCAFNYFLDIVICINVTLVTFVFSFAFVLQRWVDLRRYFQLKFGLFETHT